MNKQKKKKERKKESHKWFDIDDLKQTNSNNKNYKGKKKLMSQER